MCVVTSFLSTALCTENRFVRNKIFSVPQLPFTTGVLTRTPFFLSSFSLQRKSFKGAEMSNEKHGNRFPPEYNHQHQHHYDDHEKLSLVTLLYPPLSLPSQDEEENFQKLSYPSLVIPRFTTFFLFFFT